MAPPRTLKPSRTVTLSRLKRGGQNPFPPCLAVRLESPSLQVSFPKGLVLKRQRQRPRKPSATGDTEKNSRSPFGESPQRACLASEAVWPPEEEKTFPLFFREKIYRFYDLQRWRRAGKRNALQSMFRRKSFRGSRSKQEPERLAVVRAFFVQMILFDCNLATNIERRKGALEVICAQNCGKFLLNGTNPKEDLIRLDISTLPS